LFPQMGQCDADYVSRELETMFNAKELLGDEWVTSVATAVILSQYEQHLSRFALDIQEIMAEARCFRAAPCQILVRSGGSGRGSIESG